MPSDQSSIPPKTTTGHHDAFAIQGINQESTPLYENPWFGPTQRVVGLRKARSYSGVVRNSMARSCLSANGYMWVFVLASCQL